MSLAGVLYAITTGPDRRRRRLAAVGLTIFFGMIAAVVAGSIATDRALALRPLLAGASGTGIGIVVLACGAALWIWCLIQFKGRAVPANPPRELVTTGPYAWVRNPMLIGVGVTLFGLGILLHSASMVFVWLNVAGRRRPEFSGSRSFDSSIDAIPGNDERGRSDFLSSTILSATMRGVTRSE